MMIVEVPQRGDIAGFKNRKGHQPRNVVAFWIWKRQGQTLPLTLQQGPSPANTLILLLVELTFGELWWSSDLQGCTIINLCCFKSFFIFCLTIKYHNEHHWIYFFACFVFWLSYIKWKFWFKDDEPLFNRLTLTALLTSEIFYQFSLILVTAIFGGEGEGKKWERGKLGMVGKKVLAFLFFHLPPLTSCCSGFWKPTRGCGSRRLSPGTQGHANLLF